MHTTSVLNRHTHKYTHAHILRLCLPPGNELFYESTSILIGGNKSPSPSFLLQCPPLLNQTLEKERRGRSPWAPRVAQTIADLQGFKFLRGPLTNPAVAPFRWRDPASLLPRPRTKTNATLWHEYWLLFLHLLWVLFMEISSKPPWKPDGSIESSWRSAAINHSINHSLHQYRFICRALLTKCWVVC